MSHVGPQVPGLFYLKDEFFDPGSLGQEVQHGEAGVGPHRGHGHPVTSSGAGADVVRKARQVVHESVHPTFVQTSNMDSDMDTERQTLYKIQTRELLASDWLVESREVIIIVSDTNLCFRTQSGGESPQCQ